MGLTLIFGIFLLICVIIWVMAKANSWYDTAMGFACASACLGLVVLILVAVIIFNPLGVKADIAEFHAIKDTFDTARNNPDISQFELAAIQPKVAEANQWLANARFWTKHWLTSWFWPREEVLGLQPIM